MLKLLKNFSYRLTTSHLLIVTCTPAGSITLKRTCRDNNRNKLKGSSDNFNLKQHKQDQSGRSYCGKTQELEHTEYSILVARDLQWSSGATA